MNAFLSSLGRILASLVVIVVTYDAIIFWETPFVLVVFGISVLASIWVRQRVRYGAPYPASHIWAKTAGSIFLMLGVCYYVARHFDSYATLLAGMGFAFVLWWNEY